MTEQIPVTGIDDNPAPPAAVQLDPSVIGLIASEVGKTVRNIIPPQAPPMASQSQRASFLEAWRANQIQNGANAQQLDELIMMVEASHRDKIMEAEQHRQQNAVAEFYNDFWRTMDDVFDGLAEKMPALRVAKDGLFKQAWDLLQSRDSRYADIASHIDMGKRLTTNQATRLLTFVSDEYLRSIGVVRSEAPVSAKGSAPTQAGRTAGGDRPVFLDVEQELFYRQFKGELGDEAARELARTFKQD